jgi:hypothetical protein
MIFKRCNVLLLTLFFLYTAALFAEERGLQSTSSASPKSPILGHYAAFIVGINAYKEWYPLQTAVKDATDLKDLLVSRYDFEKVLLITDADATQLHVLNSLKTFAAGLKENDNLLIYYAGHGQLDEFTGDGYWIPVDGKHKDSTTWISHLLVKGILSSERVKAKNIALVSDSCYAGALLRSGPSPVSTGDDKYQAKILALSTRKSRQVFTSGGLEPVADGGREGHSLFAYRGKDWGQLVDVNFARISPEQYLRPAGKPQYNPAEPWTGVWDVEGSSRFAGYTWGMKQTGEAVKSTKESTFEFWGKVRGNELEGTINADSSAITRFSIKMSQDRQSFEGYLFVTSNSILVKGKRTE